MVKRLSTISSGNDWNGIPVFQLIPVLTCRDNIMIANECVKKCKKDYFDTLTEQLDIKDL